MRVSRAVMLGIFSGLGQVFFLDILFAGGSAKASDPILPSLVVLGFAIVVGYAVSDMRDNVAALLSSLIVTFLSFTSLSILGGPYTPLTEADFHRFIAFYPIAFFLAGLGGSFVGLVLSGKISQMGSKYTLRLNSYRIVLLALFLATLSLGSSLLVQYQIAQLERTINLENVQSVENEVLVWGAGVENISANFGPVEKASGILEVDYFSTACATYHIIILDSIVTPKNGPGVYCRVGVAGGFASIPFVSAPSPGEHSVNFTAWFHNDDCSTSGCPAGSMIYKVSIRS